MRSGKPGQLQSAARSRRFISSCSGMFEGKIVITQWNNERVLWHVRKSRISISTRRMGDYLGAIREGRRSENVGRRVVEFVITR
jgi:hypothetical protein